MKRRSISSLWNRVRLHAGFGVKAVSVLAGLAVLTGQSSAQTSIRAVQVATGLSQPLDVVAIPGDTGRLFIVEQVGRILILDLTTSPPTLSPTPFLDIRNNAAVPVADRLTAASGERGLLGLAFDPDYVNNGYIYINYTTLGSPFFTRIDRLQATGAPFANTAAAFAASTINTSTRLTMLQFQQDFANHNGGAVEFGPDGMLYVGSGDGGSSHDPNERAQNPNTLLGKLIRLDVRDESTTDGDGLWVPDDNPFRSEGGSVRPYIWASGLRNPWRMHFDFGGNLWIGDVGQDLAEEINYQPRYIPGPGGNFAQVAGLNYGWDCREGFAAAPSTDTFCSPANNPPNPLPTFTDPIKQYLHSGDSACSITGGVVYNGSAMPDLQGHYFHADYCGNWLRSFRYNGTTISDERVWTAQLNLGTTTVNGLVAFGEDAMGEVYYVSINLGRVFKIVPAIGTPCGAPCPSPANQLATLFFDDFESDLGWTASRGPGATDGDWERGVPVPSLNGYQYNPPFASGGFGAAYVTENSDPAAGQTTSDVDGGAVILTSPPLDFSLGDITICYDYFLVLTQVGGTNPDGLFLEVSSNGTAGPWVLVDSITVPPGAECIWNTRVVTQSQLSAAGVANGPNMRVRFLAADNSSPGQSIVEAGIDNFRVTTGNPPADCNNNGIADSVDIAMGTSADCNNNGIPDECEIADAYALSIAMNNPSLRIDTDGGPVGSRVAGSMFFNTNCIGCHGANAAGTVTAPSLRNKDRIKIRNRLYLIEFHPGGGFPGSTAQQHADLESFFSDFGTFARPDGIIDVCQTNLPDCDDDGVPDGRALLLASEPSDLNYDGIPDWCQCLCDVNNDGITDLVDLLQFLEGWMPNLGQTGVGLAGDYTVDNVVDLVDLLDFLSCWLPGCF
ncbi:MAG: PQQ-dependent sugar dehydrogenase [Phycisphaeraceae bacterium]|nr:PQQ-dependent sugar dehydrogenase [Phycisphaeraceae bacterium]